MAGHYRTLWTSKYGYKMAHVEKSTLIMHVFLANLILWTIEGVGKEGDLQHWRLTSMLFKSDQRNKIVRSNHKISQLPLTTLLPTLNNTSKLSIQYRPTVVAMATPWPSSLQLSQLAGLFSLHCTGVKGVSRSLSESLPMYDNWMKSLIQPLGFFEGKPHSPCQIVNPKVWEMVSSRGSTPPIYLW